MPRSYQYKTPNVPHHSVSSSSARYSPSHHFVGHYITPESFADAISQRDHLASAVAPLQGDPVSFAEFVFLNYLCRNLRKIRQNLLDQEHIARQQLIRFFQHDPPNNCMIGCSIENTLVDKLFQGQTTLLQTPPVLLVILLNHDLYPFHHVYLEPLPFTFTHRRQSLKHDNVNGDGNSSKKNSQKNHLKELAKTPSSSSGLASKIESMIQLPSRGVMLQFSPFHLPDTHITCLSPIATPLLHSCSHNS